MLSRRHFLSTVPVAAVTAGCSREGSSASVAASSTSTSNRAALVLTTALGRVRLSLPSPQSSATTDMSAAWKADVEAAARRIADVWGASRADGAHGELRVIVCGDDAEFAASTDGLDPDTAGVTTEHGVFLSPAAATTLTPAGRRVLVAHELTHAWLGQYGSDRTQWWVKEGAAEWTAAPLAPLPERQRWPALVTAQAGGALRDSAPPTSETGSELGYEWAHAYVTYLAAQVGAAQVVSLVRSRPTDATAAVRAMTSGRQRFRAWLAAQLR